VSASSGKWRGAKRVGIYSREGFDFGSGGSRFLRHELVAARRQPVASRRQLVAARREQLDTRRELVGASW
jgi:hypothetical protein